MTTDIEKGKAGQLFEDFLREQGSYEETTERAIKKVLSYQLAETMRSQHISKEEMSRRLHTSQPQLDCLLDPENDSVPFSLLSRAARLVGRSIRLELV